MSKEQTPIELIIELIMTDPTATLCAKALCDNVLKNYLVVEKEHINAKVLEALERDEKEYPKMYWEAKQVIEDDKQRYHPSDRINAYGYIRGFEHAIEFLKNNTKQK